jgi:hypothetical protein
MDKFMMGLGALFMGVFLIFVAAFIGGTLVWLLWPVAVPAVLPGLVASGMLAAKLSWWQAVCLAWLIGLLFKGSTATTNNTVKK